MTFIVLVILVTFSLDFAKNCKAVKYEYKQFGVKRFGYGAKKGCAVNLAEDEGIEESKPAEELNVIECSAIKNDADLTDFGLGDLSGMSDEDLEINCNLFTTCVWKGGKCKASSCPVIVEKAQCTTNFKNGKCEKLKGGDCKKYGEFLTPTPGNKNCSNGEYVCPNSNQYSSGCNNETTGTGYNYYCRLIEDDDPRRGAEVPCSKLTDYYHYTYIDYDVMNAIVEKYTSDEEKICQYKCEHPSRGYYVTTPYQYTIPGRKYCHRQLGCLYAEKGEGACSVWSVWAFVLTLVVLILVVLGVVIFVVVALFMKRK